MRTRRPVRAYGSCPADWRARGFAVGMRRGGGSERARGVLRRARPQGAIGRRRPAEGASRMPRHARLMAVMLVALVLGIGAGLAARPASAWAAPGCRVFG